MLAKTLRLRPDKGDNAFQAFTRLACLLRPQVGTRLLEPFAKLDRRSALAWSRSCRERCRKAFWTRSCSWSMFTLLDESNHRHAWSRARNSSRSTGPHAMPSTMSATYTAADSP